jgi:hypothetical protein
VAAAGLTDNARGYNAVVGSSLTARAQSADTVGLCDQHGLIQTFRVVDVETAIASD